MLGPDLHCTMVVFDCALVALHGMDCSQVLSPIEQQKDELCTPLAISSCNCHRWFHSNTWIIRHHKTLCPSVVSQCPCTISHVSPMVPVLLPSCTCRASLHPNRKATCFHDWCIHALLMPHCMGVACTAAKRTSLHAGLTYWTALMAI